MSAVAKGVGSTLPVYIEKAGGGVLVDVDGNSLIDLGAGIAVVNAGNAHPAVVSAVQEQVAAFTHTCFMVTPYDGYVVGLRGAQPAHPGRLREALGALQLGRGGGRERRQGRPGRDRPRRGRRVRPRLPRPDQPDDGDDRQGDALQARLRAVRRRGLPRAAVLPLPRAGRRSPGTAAAKRAIEYIEKQVGADQVACVVIEPIQGEGGFVVPGARLPDRPVRVVHGQRCRLRRRRDPDRLRPDRRDVRLPARGRRARPDHHGQGHRRRPAARRADRPGRADGRRPRRRPRRHVRRQPGRLRRGAGLDGRDAGRGPARPGQEHRVADDPAADRAGRAAPADRRRPRPRRDAGHRDRRAGHAHRRRRRGRPDLLGLPPARAC